jgi:O-antigen/teichoic acid export membrane protein
MYLFYKREQGRSTPLKTENEGDRVEMISILRLSIPVTIGSSLLPLSGLLDSVLAVRLLSAYSTDAVALYGLFSGGAVTVINLPVSVCYGIAAASIPAVATAAAKGANVKKSVFFSLFVTIAIALPAAVGLYFFAEPAARIIFRSLKGEELTTLTALIKTFSLSALTLSCTQTLSACLTAQGEARHSAFSMLVGITVKTITYSFLLRNPQISVFGLAYATNICYLVAFLLDLVYNIIVWRKQKRKNGAKGAKENDHSYRFRRRKRRSY